jgi:hypothetical protein
VWPINQPTFPYAPVSLLILGCFSANRTETTATATSGKGEFQTRIYSFSIQLGAVHTRTIAVPSMSFFAAGAESGCLDHSFTCSASYEERAWSEGVGLPQIGLESNYRIGSDLT